MREAGVLIDLAGLPLYWHTPDDRQATILPDSRDLWDVIWEHRERLLGFAHSHPGHGWPGPSVTDLTTFQAIEAGLGRRLNWWIASADRLILIHKEQSVVTESPGYVVKKLVNEPFWVCRLRELSIPN